MTQPVRPKFPLFALPKDILGLVIDLLPPEDVARLARVCSIAERIKTNNLYGVPGMPPRLRNVGTQVVPALDLRDIIRRWLNTRILPSDQALFLATGMDNENMFRKTLARSDLTAAGIGRALALALSRGHKECKKLLISKQIPLFTAGAGAALIWLADHNHPDSVKSLLKTWYTISSENALQALFSAAIKGHAKCTRYLLRYRKDISDVAAGKVLIRAAEQGHFKCVDILLDNRSISIEDITQAIKSALEQGHKKCALLLNTHRSLRTSGFTS